MKQAVAGPAPVHRLGQSVRAVELRVHSNGGGNFAARLNDQPKAKTGTGKKPAPAPYGAGKASKTQKNPLFESRPKNFGIGE